MWLGSTILSRLDVLTEDSVDASMAWLSTSIQSLTDDTIVEQNTRAAHGDAIDSGDAVCPVEGDGIHVFEVQEMYAGGSARACQY